MAVLREAKWQHTAKHKSKFREPPLYRVVLLNDDWTPMDFVVVILQSVFGKTAKEAYAIMLLVHKKGRGIAGVYTEDIARTKTAEVEKIARQNSFPLKCIVEET